MLRWIFLGIYCIGLFLLVRSMLFEDGKISDRFTRIASLFLLPWTVYEFISLIKMVPLERTFFNIASATATIINLVITLALIIVAFFPGGITNDKK